MSCTPNFADFDQKPGGTIPYPIRQAFLDSYAAVHAMLAVPEGFPERTAAAWIARIQADLDAHARRYPSDWQD